MSIIEEKKAALLTQCPEVTPAPRSVYLVASNGVMETYSVLEVRYDDPAFRIYYSGKRPTTLDLIHIEEAAKLNPEYDRKKVLLIIRNPASLVKSTQGLRLTDIDYIKWFDQHLSANNVSRERKQRVKDEQQVLEGGKHFKCARCGKIAPNYEAVVGDITLRSNNSLTKETLAFCSASCRYHEQMAHEG